MGFFKSIGSKLKRVVSLKNLVRGVTGNFTAIGEDVVRVATTSDPKKGLSLVDTTLVPSGYTIPEPIQDILKSQDSSYRTNVINSVASIPVVQDANSFMSKLWIQSQWFKYKNWIIGFLSVLSVFLLWKFVFSKKKNTRRR
ncbi:hypothetical protein [Flavobacterium sp. LB2P53]|uniref:hypothetical protein n=1 Tax=Flavobacterium sp. LB2P53 TaxID=2497481 RepID=UPI000F84803C|nr:hypothetical protein [Flavobacterium sp. LB2P53]RTY69688.1 hypothetical protein EKL95_05880 [Flavobacterium sp. LB2P53]